MERSVVEVVRQALVHASDSDPMTFASSASHDAGVDLVVEADGMRFLIEAKSRVWPNDVPAIAHRLRRHCSPDDRSCAPVVVAPSVSERTAERLREAGISWVDLAGNCHIRFGQTLIHIEGRTVERGASRGTASLYTPKSARVVHALLLRPRARWKVTELAERTGVSLGQVSNVRRLLVQNAFAETSPEGLRLTEPRRLLLDWSKDYKPRRTAHRYYTLSRPGDLEKALADRLPAYALTEMAAAERYAPFTRYQSVAFYVPSWNAQAAKELQFRPAEGTPNVAVYEDPDGLLFAEERDSISCASPIVTYLDLVLLGGRGQDAAEHLFETILAPRWA